MDSSGVYVTGWLYGVLPGQTSSGGRDVVVRRYDSAGSVVWTRQFGSDHEDRSGGVAVGTSGVYVTGDTPGVLPGQTGAGGWDVFASWMAAADTDTRTGGETYVLCE